ncbi:MAG: transposase zinc-binding domain-containing protein [Halanaerobium sp.]
MLLQECGNPENGYAKYKYLDCGEEHIVGFSYKSGFCSRFAKVYIDKWLDKQDNWHDIDYLSFDNFHKKCRERSLFICWRHSIRQFSYLFSCKVV